ncbi:MAG: hypothetical protein PW999_29365 [Paraburkholderia tropica]|nr:hypothetical protein [Paraburkholderia tropica]
MISKANTINYSPFQAMTGLFRLIFPLNLLAALSLLSYANTDEIISDDFSGDAGSIPVRKAETDNTGISGNIWNWSSGSTYLEKGFIISAVTGVYAGGRIGIKAPAGLVEVAGVCEVNTGLTGSSVYTPVQWVAVGFATTKSDSWVGNQPGNLLWGLVRPDGRWTLFQNGTTKTLADSTESTKLPPFDEGASIKVSVQYNPKKSVAALFVDGVNISGWLDTDITANTIGAAGVLIYPNATSDPRVAKVDSFTVSNVSSIGTVPNN